MKEHEREHERISYELEKFIDEAAFLVAFSKKDGEPIAIIPGRDCKILKKGEGAIPTELITYLAEKYGKDKLETKCFTFPHVFGSPGCYIPNGRGGWICICCG